jgi:hypothetical protein
MTERGQSVTEIIIMLAIVCALVGAGAAAYAYWQDRRDNDSLDAGQRAYLRAVATSQAGIYIRALAGESLATPESAPEAADTPAASTTVPTASQPRSETPGADPSVSTRPFTVSGSGQRVVEIPVTSSTVHLRVSIDADQTAESTWVWCFDADFGLAPADADTASTAFRTYCANQGRVEPATGLVVAEKSIAIDPAWPKDTKYVWRILCLGNCSWQLDVSGQ